MDGGGDTSKSENFSLSGTIGQPDAGSVMRGGGYFVIGRFRSGNLVLLHNQVYIPLVNR